jgi:ABC-type multidrug transport system fused ATPase/permease subunit
VKSRLLRDVGPLPAFENLPTYAALICVRELGPFRTRFIILSLAGIVSNILAFVAVWIIGRILTAPADKPDGASFTRLIVLLVICKAVGELIDYFRRRSSTRTDRVSKSV